MKNDGTTLPVLFAVALSGSVALFASSSVCAAEHECKRTSSCTALGDGFCSFSNSVGPNGLRVFNFSSPTSALQALERGVCPLGERVGHISGKDICTRQRSFPNALNTEITTTETVPHRRFCGRWLDSSAPSRETRYWAFFDAGDVAKDLNDAIVQKYEIRNAITNAGKFLTRCNTMIQTSSVAASSQIAFHYLRSLLPAPYTRSELVRASGVLAAFFCDAPLKVGITMRFKRISVDVASGSLLAPAEVAARLYEVGESRNTIRDAEAFATAALASNRNYVDKNDIQEVVSGSLRGTTLDGVLHLDVAQTVSAPHLAGFLDAVDKTSVQAGHAYLLGLASTCASEVRNVVSGEIIKENSNDNVRDHQLALGRLPSKNEGLDMITPSDMLNATSTGWSALRRRGRSSDATSSCEYALKTTFPDELDSSVFNFLVPPRLYERLETVARIVRDAVRVTVLGPIFSPLFDDPDGLAALVQTSVMRVAGAPRTSWAGRASPRLSPGFESDDGTFVMMLKQARAVYNDRIGMAGLGVSSAPPLMSSTNRNAYMIFQAGVAMVLPGILVPPFADDRYDDASLYSRIGYVVAHEFAHVTAAVTWNEMSMAKFLGDLQYAPSEFVEAIADIIAVAAVVNTGKVDNSTMCSSVSQLWCASTPFLDAITPSSPTGSHPPANARGDRLCKFLSKYF
jgi:hypothetical protein